MSLGGPSLSVCMYVCLSDRDRETERQTDRQTDRETERQRDTETEKQRDRETERQKVCFLLFSR